MGYKPGLDRQEPDVDEAIGTIMAAAQKHVARGIRAAHRLILRRHFFVASALQQLPLISD